MTPVPRVTAIGSRSNPLVVGLRRLASHPEAYRQQQQFLLEGEHLCRAWAESSGSGSAAQAVIGETAWAEPVWRQLASRAGKVAVLADPLMRFVSLLETPPPLMLLIDWPGSGAPRAATASVVLDRLQDAGNVGTILRCAAAFGFRQVVALKGTAALWSPKVLRAAMGAHFALDLVEASGEDALDALDVPLLATSSHALAALTDVELPWPCAWVIGNEGQGVSTSLLQRCAHTVRIPQPGGGESLNAAVAAAICLYESSCSRASMAAPDGRGAL